MAGMTREQLAEEAAAANAEVTRLHGELADARRASANTIREAYKVPMLRSEVERLTAVIENLTAAINRADAQGVHVMTTASIRAHLQATDGGETP